MKDKVIQLFSYQDALLCLTQEGKIFRYYLEENTWILITLGPEGKPKYAY